MNEEQKEKLNHKRRQLQAKVELKIQKDRVAPQINHIEKSGYSFVIHDKFENLNWIDSNVRVRNKNGYNGVHGDFQIDVDDLKVSSDLKIKEDEIDSDKFSELFSSLIPKQSSLIICYQGGDPELEISNKAFLSKPTVFFSRPETWVITTERTWIIEYIWDQGVIRFIELNNSNPILVEKIIIEE